MQLLLANILVFIVALEHVGFLVLEMFMWTSPAGRKVFGTSPEFAKESAPLAANQGLYNGFLAAGLFYALITSPSEVSYQFKVFFLICVIIAGCYGAATVSRRILFVQALPALIALILVLI